MEEIIIALLVATTVFVSIFWIGALIFSDRDLLNWNE
jgi:hypothetical protein